MNYIDDFPQELSFLFRAQSCLKINSEEGTWLCTEVSGTKRVIVKAAFTEEAAALLKNEEKILTLIHQTSDTMTQCFPEVMISGREGSFQYLSRSYIPGMSLADYVETEELREGISRDKALRILFCVLEQLRFLHRLNPPVIHRDIKPQNIIVESDSGDGLHVRLIDFGIARVFRQLPDGSAKVQDTVAMGTFPFAPPEQFGYRQTDERSDLYAAGVLLRYCLTRDYEEKADQQIDADIRKVISKATQFDPKNRYPNADEMIRDLRRLLPKDEKAIFEAGHERRNHFSFSAAKVSRSTKMTSDNESLKASTLRVPHTAENNQLRSKLRFGRRKGLLTAGVLFGLLICIGVGFYGIVRRQTGGIDGISADGGGQIMSTADGSNNGAIQKTDRDVWQFREPLIEEAVRTKLNLPDEDITREDLSSITSIHIFGKQIYTDENAFVFNGVYVIPRISEYESDGLWLENGGIESLEDLTAMPNLEEVCLYRQNISDLSELMEEDSETKTISPDNLEECSETNTGDNMMPVHKLASEKIRKLKNKKLRYLGLGYNPVSDLSVLSGNSQITGLNLSCLELSDLSFLSNLTELRSLVLAGYGSIRLENFDHLPLEELNLVDTWPSDEENLTHFTKLRKITVGKLYPGLLQQLSELSLTNLTMNHVSGVVLADLQILQHLQQLTYRAASEDGPETLTEEALSFPDLRSLDLKGLQIPGFQALQNLEHMEILGIYDANCLGWEGLDALQNLHTLVVTPEQKKALENMYPDREWEYIIAA